MLIVSQFTYIVLVNI